uniref:Uncharacterized protein n=1 Tax=Zosterops lateralis melanops TaxID=1220523 RepID=A0A8D2QM30_ZOSLA
WTVIQRKTGKRCKLGCLLTSLFGNRYGEVTVILLLFAPQINSVHCHCGSDLLLSSFHAIVQHFKEPF